MSTPRLCLVVADAARARLYSFDHAATAPTTQLREHADLVNPERRLRPSDIQSDTPGTSHSSTSVGHHGDHHQHEVDRRFAVEIAKHLATLLAETGDHQVVVVASHHMLGLLRATVSTPPGVEFTDLARDLTRETTPQLHDHLAKLGILPPRPRTGVTA